MRLPHAAQTTRPWRIHEIVPDFRLEDVWALPTPGGPDDFPRLVEQMARLDPERGTSAAVRALFAFRWKLGALLGWDDDATARWTLRDRLPEDLRAAPSRVAVTGLPFHPLYMLDDEWAAEIANRTMHGVVHLGWVPDETGGYRGQMAVYVRPNGLLGSAYMLAIKPFRHFIVYPQMIAAAGRQWRAASGAQRG